MRNQNTKVRCIKRKYKKCAEICKAFGELQSAYADTLEQDENIKEFQCNVPLDDIPLDGNYTTDFLITLANGELRIRECVYRRFLAKPLTAKVLDASREYWLRRGVKDWGIVMDAEK